MPEKNILSEFSFFSDLTLQELDLLASKCEELDFNKDDIVFHFEKPAEHFYGLIAGEVELSLVFTDKVLKTEV